MSGTLETIWARNYESRSWAFIPPMCGYELELFKGLGGVSRVVKARHERMRRDHHKARPEFCEGPNALLES